MASRSWDLEPRILLSAGKLEIITFSHSISSLLQKDFSPADLESSNPSFAHVLEVVVKHLHGGELDGSGVLVDGLAKRLVEMVENEDYHLFMRLMGLE